MDAAAGAAPVGRRRAGRGHPRVPRRSALRALPDGAPEGSRGALASSVLLPERAAAAPRLRTSRDPLLARRAVAHRRIRAPRGRPGRRSDPPAPRRRPLRARVACPRLRGVHARDPEAGGDRGRVHGPRARGKAAQGASPPAHAPLGARVPDHGRIAEGRRPGAVHRRVPRAGSGGLEGPRGRPRPAASRLLRGDGRGCRTRREAAAARVAARWPASRPEDEPARRRPGVCLQDHVRRELQPVLARRAAGAGQRRAGTPVARAPLHGLVRRAESVHDQPSLGRPPGDADGLLLDREPARRVRRGAPAPRPLLPTAREARMTLPQIRIDPEIFAAYFDHRPFHVRHALAGHPLFALPRLMELARRLPEAFVEYNAGALPVGVRPDETPRNGLSAEETVRRIAECGSWMVLKRVEQDPEYEALLDQCLDEVAAQAAVAPRMLRREGFIFLSSPGAVTPFHLDPEHNFLLQIQGSKTVSMWGREDRFVLPEAELEKFYAAFEHRNLPWREVFQTTAWVVPLKPGQGLHFPVAVPHWVQNGPEVSVSFSITFRSESSHHRELVYRANAKLRKMGLSPRPPGHSILLDSTKRAAFAALSELKRAFVRRGDAPRT